MKIGFGIGISYPNFTTKAIINAENEDYGFSYLFDDSSVVLWNNNSSVLIEDEYTEKTYNL